MSSVATALGVNYSDHPLRLAFLKWQCRVPSDRDARFRRQT